MEFFKKIWGQIKNLWGKWSVLQKVICAAIVVTVIIGIVALFGVSSTPSLAPVIDAPIRDEALRDRIVARINNEGVTATVNPAGIIQVQDKQTAQRMRGILIREDLIPQGTDPWALFDRDRWTITDFERNVNLRRAITQMITDHIKSLDDVDNANVIIEVAKDRLFASEQNATSASVIITPKPGSDIADPNRKKIEGIQKLLKFAVEGLKDENIVITDHNGLVLNDFEGMKDNDRQTLIERQQKFIRTQEAQYRAVILAALQKTFSEKRVQDLNIKIDMDMSKKSSNTDEFFPITIKERTPGLAYDDSVLVESITRSSSESETKWTGSGHYPEGPAGPEPNMPPAYKDMSNLWGSMEQKTNVNNKEINKKVTQEETSPQIDRVTVSVNIDGTWKWKYDEKGKPVIQSDNTIEREYTPLPESTIRATQTLIQNAIGYNAARGDSVSVHNIPFDRTKEFGDEDAAYFRKKQMQTTIIVFLTGLTLLLISFIIFRIAAREMERRRRLAEEERARREQALRESAMMEAEQEGMEVSISMEERQRMELMESVVNLTKEHPEDCAQLIRTWILEE